jgi:hypothetical protein
VEILVIGLHWCHISLILLKILIVIQCMSHLVIEGLTDLLSANVINEFRSGLDADLSLYLLDESVCIYLALIEALVYIIKVPSGSVSELSDIIEQIITLEDFVELSAWLRVLL